MVFAWTTAFLADSPSDFGDPLSFCDDVPDSRGDLIIEVQDGRFLRFGHFDGLQQFNVFDAVKAHAETGLEAVVDVQREAVGHLVFIVRPWDVVEIFGDAGANGDKIVRI